MRTKKATKNADGLDDEDVPTHLLGLGLGLGLGSLEQRDFRVRVRVRVRARVRVREFRTKGF